ncbi:glyoxal oxidase [Ceratobasidium sp. AG-Ba]|nr:glyoxal oxidase [Ceratobasidium sp. AG-Ba]QRW14761.1 glyoxal oxidase [Ceratobasidium sp. AG-Ba]
MASRAATFFSLTLLQLCRAQSLRKGVKPNTFEVVGNSGVSAQQAYLGNDGKFVKYDVEKNTFRPMDVVTNTFCAGGSVMGDGTLINIGGNQPVKAGGLTHVTGDPDDPYKNGDGGQSVRLLSPCDGETCEWTMDPKPMTTRRWYPTVETLEDGSVMIIGGNQYGGFVNSEGNNNPTFEYYPSRGAPIQLPMLTRTLPANLYTLTWMMPSGLTFMQTNLGTQMFDKASPETNTEYPLKDMPLATATILFCGGSDLQPDQWRASDPLVTYPADASCVSMTPDVSPDWKIEDSMPFGRSMGNFVLLPNGKTFLVNGANTGVAGYGNESWVIGQSYADSPTTQPLIYDPELPSGSRWVSKGLSQSPIARMYHSIALLLLDGSVLVSGSNPNADYVGPDMGYKYPTEYRVERFYPDYYNEPRPEPTGMPETLSYGGDYFNLTMGKEDVGKNVDDIKVVVIRTGFSTHAMNMGQRMVELDRTYSVAKDGSATIHVSQMPPNPFIMAPGPAVMYTVVNGVPSMGKPVMIGSGKIEKQSVLPVQELPSSTIETVTGTHAAEGSGAGNGTKNSSSRLGVAIELALGASLFGLLFW